MSISSNTIDPNFLPNLPGFKPRVLPTPQKKHFFAIVNGGTFLKEDASYLPSLMGSGGVGEIPDDLSVTSIGNTSAIRMKRTAKIGDDCVTLTFQGYFEENPIISTQGAKQVRHCNIFFFTEDGTIRIVEKPQINSGVSQGTLVRRTVVAKEDGSPISEYDMVLGEQLKVYGRVYTLYDCDKFTRDYCEKKLGLGATSGQVAVPTDSYQQHRMTLQPGTGEEEWGRYHSKRNDNKSYVEARLGHNANNAGREGFIRFGNQALRFRCVWDNTHNLYGDLLEFNMIYYLSDDTVEIISAPNPRSKEKGITKLLKRSKLPKNFANGASLGERPVSDAFFHWVDIYVGQMLEVYGRQLQVVDADRFTREFFDSFEMPLGEMIAIPQPEIVVHAREIPPPTGFGSEQDSMRSVNGSLLPGPIPAKKLGENRILSFFCRLLSGGVDDEARRFVISYYLVDNTVKVVEPPIRNSGFAGGLFLSRRELKREDGEVLTFKDLYIGCQLRVLKHLFLLYDSNEATMYWMEDKGLPRSNIYMILDKLRPSLYKEAKSGELAAKCHAMEKPENGSGMITQDDFMAVLDSYGLMGNSKASQISEHEVRTLVRGNGNKSQVFDFTKIVAELIEPTDYFK